ncbi:hypothetical protein [Senegalimassilia anaerobia]|uniref:hypothetical protein n=1 Tax=Senegalimassilia anaerobia TaxID=1473216 RepID=UPI0026ED5B1E|nr:hypothetical protein [Senegalimassilia anaerobia]
MKLQNMKLAQKWREYAGPKDERLEAENAKIYKLGFMLLSFGMLTLLVYQIMAQQVAWVHDGAGEAFRLFANPVDAVMYAWLFIVMTVCAVLQTRKGYVDTNRFSGKQSTFPRAISCSFRASPASQAHSPSLLCAASPRRRSYRSKASFGERTWQRA